MTNNLQATPLSVLLAFTMVAITLFISYREKLQLEKEIIISVVRMAIQLAIVGIVLQWIFDINHFWVTVAMLLVMNINAAWSASKRGQGIPHALKNSLIAVSLSSVIALGVMVGSGTLEFIPSQMIPVNGMVIGTTMRTIGMVFNQMRQLFKDRRQQVQEMLALGASPKQAGKEIMRLVLNMSLQPTLDNIKTTGLVTLPGLMSGLIFAGVAPGKAILYQIVVMFMMLSATAIGAYTVVFLTYPKFFTQRAQLKTKINDPS